MTLRNAYANLATEPKQDAQIAILATPPVTALCAQYKFAPARSGTGAVQLPDLIMRNGAILTNHSTSATMTFSATVGNQLSKVVDGTGNGAFIEPGGARALVADNLNKFWVNGADNAIYTIDGAN